MKNLQFDAVNNCYATNYELSLKSEDVNAVCKDFYISHKNFDLILEEIAVFLDTSTYKLLSVLTVYLKLDPQNILVINHGSKSAFVYLLENS